MKKWVPERGNRLGALAENLLPPPPNHPTTTTTIRGHLLQIDLQIQTLNVIKSKAFACLCLLQIRDEGWHGEGRGGRGTTACCVPLSWQPNPRYRAPGERFSVCAHINRTNET